MHKNQGSPSWAFIVLSADVFNDMIVSCSLLRVKEMLISGSHSDSIKTLNIKYLKSYSLSPLLERILRSQTSVLN